MKLASLLNLNSLYLYTPMKFIFLFSLSIIGLISTPVLAQNKVSMAVTENADCKALAAKKMTFLSDGSLQSDKIVELEMEKLKACGIDDYDVQFFGSIDALSSLLKKMTKEKRLEFMTYGDLIINIQRMKETDNFQKLKSFALASQLLAERTASLQNWSTDLQLFNELGASEAVKDKVYKYLREHPENTLTYQEVLMKLQK